MRTRLLMASLCLSALLGSCMDATLQPASEANFTALDRKLLADPPYEKVAIPEPFRRHIVEYDRKEEPGAILVDTDKRYLYYVLPGNKAIRYGVAVGEEAMAWSGVATVGRMAEWPAWVPTKSEIERLGVPTYVSPGPQNPMGARALYLFQGNRTRSIVSTAPISRNTLGKRFPPAASG